MKLPGTRRRSKKATAARALGSTWLKALGALALAGGLGAAAWRKLRGSEPDPFATAPYEPPTAVKSDGGAPGAPAAQAPEPAPVPEPAPDEPEPAPDEPAPEEPEPAPDEPSAAEPPAEERGS